ncbi:hypothetical protein EV421DRAFT_1789295 [Armillaria borealis]|uniref:Uncharacterized protein n=1 Tax=Armillaria borealis TaxID=47425 RepID=A0AA39JTJ2_9AGAR|nr:hypothetical protein EV421DRAFT_1789295 [Armillaria borealis]
MQHDAVAEIVHSQKGDFNLTVVQQTETENGRRSWVSIQVCFDEDEAYSVPLSKAEEASSRLFSLDTAQKQTGVKDNVARTADVCCKFGVSLVCSLRLHSSVSLSSLPSLLFLPAVCSTIQYCLVREGFYFSRPSSNSKMRIFRIQTRSRGFRLTYQPSRFLQ